MAARLRINPVAIAVWVLALGWAPLSPGAAMAGDEPQYTSEFRLGDCDWENVGKNPYFPLVPGFYSLLEGESDDEFVVLEIRVLGETETIRMEIDGKGRRIRTRVLQETEFIDGELFEISRNFFAICKETGDVFYFGEDVDFYEDGEIVSHEGAWRAGVDGARPGIIMPGTFLLGSRYFQEVAPGVAEDRGEHIGMGIDVETEAGEFGDCVEILDTNALDPKDKGDVKIYCPGVGLTIDEDLELVAF